MTKYEIELIGEEGIDDTYEGTILWKAGYFAIHATSEGKQEGYIPLTAIKKIMVVKEAEIHEVDI